MSREESFRAAMSAHGIEYTGELYFDGRLHRFKANGDHARNSWYVSHPGPPAAGEFGCWKRAFKQTWCERNGNLSQAEMQCVRQQWREIERQQEKVEGDRQKKAREIADWIFKRAKPVQSHAYLTAKGVRPLGELRESYRGELLLPLRDINGNLHSLQFIAPDDRYDGERNKNFLAGGRTKGCFYTLFDKADGPLVLCEGYATGASIHQATGHAVICAINCGNLSEVAKAARELWPEREVIVAADDDRLTDGNPGLTKATAAAKSIGAKLAVPQFHDNGSKPTDFNDLATTESLDVVREQIGAAEIVTETDADTFARLAELPPAEYDRCREAEAAALGIRVKTLDADVERRRRWTGGNDSTLQGSAIELPEIEPWPDPVDAAEVLDAIAKSHCAYVALPSYAADACALWEAACHCFEAFDIMPRLNVTSPEPQCGKTTLLDVIALFVPRPLRTENFTAAVLFRLIQARKPTILADEYDSWLNDNDELRGLLNAGHRRGGQVARCEGDNHEVRAFRVFGPAVLCGIGPLPGTLHDRSLKIRLERAKPGELQERFDSRHTDRERELCRRLARWCSDNRRAFESCDPKMPDGAFNRLADNWRPPFAIAEIAGGDWPRRCAEAFAKLTSTDDLDAHGVGTLLLCDIAKIFADESADRVPSARLAELLAEIEGRPWAEWGRQRKPISPNQLANQLRRFGISPRGIRIGGETPRGYLLEDFREAFARYLPETPFSECNSATTLGKTPVSEVQHPDDVLHPENVPYTRECCGVARCTQEHPDLDSINREFAFAAEADAKHAAPVVMPAEDDSELVL